MARYSTGTKTAEAVPSLNASVRVSVNSRSGEMPPLRMPQATPPQGLAAQAPDTPVGGVAKLPLPIPPALDTTPQTPSIIEEYPGSGLLEIADTSGPGLMRPNDSSGSGLINAADVSVLPDDTFQRIDPPTSLPTIEGFFEALED